MGQLIFCDLCQATIDERDLRIVKMEDVEGNLKIQTVEICTICAGRIKTYIEDKEWLK